MAKLDTCKLSRFATGAIRKRAVRAVVEQSMSRKDAVLFFGVTPESVCLWMKACRSGGGKALCDKLLGRPEGQKPTGDHAAGICGSIVGRCPGQLCSPGFLGTRELAGA